MKELADGTKVPNRTYYYLLEWNDFDVDSFYFLEIMMEIEKVFGISITLEQLEEKGFNGIGFNEMKLKDLYDVVKSTVKDNE